MRRHERAEQRPHPKNGREEAEGLWPRVQRLLRQHREEDVEVQAEGAHDENEAEHQPDLLVAAGEGNPLFQADEERARAFATVDRVELLRAHHQQTNQHCDVAACVDGEADAGAGAGDQHSRERRSEDSGPVEEPRVEADRVR